MTPEQKALRYTSALANTCPACNAQPGQRCSAPTDASRRPVPWHHYAREDKA